MRNRLESTRIEDQFKGKSITKRNSQWIWFDCTFACILSTQKKPNSFVLNVKITSSSRFVYRIKAHPITQCIQTHTTNFFSTPESLFAILPSVFFVTFLSVSPPFPPISRIKETIFTFYKTHFARRKICQIWPDYRLLNISMILLYKPFITAFKLQDANFYGIFEKFIFTGAG